MNAKKKQIPLCPGIEGIVKDTKDLDPGTFRRLVGRRSRYYDSPKQGYVETEETRRSLEEGIEKYFEKIHNVKELLPASFLGNGAIKSDAVCRIKIGGDLTPSGYGTGFLITKNLIMTNNHVLRTQNVAASSIAEFGYEIGEEMVRVALDSDIFFLTHAELDFTIVGCNDSRLDEIEPVRLLRNPATVTRKERVNIIQHPSARKKEIAIHDNEVLRILDKVIRYRTDTEPGSSGSPVFNNNWDLIALHHAGWYEDDPKKAINEGIRISSIVAYILNLYRIGTRRDEGLESIVHSITDSSPYLGFFDVFGVENPKDDKEVEVPDFQGTPDFADVGFWNIEHFNDGVTNQRVNDVAEVVSRLSLDLLGLTEVQSGAMDRLVETLALNGDNMNYVLLDVPWSQDIAILYDQDTTTVALNEGIAERNEELLNARTSTGQTAFPRHPLFAECVVSGANQKEVKFIMIVVHLKAFGDATSRSRRRLAAQMLAEIIEDIRQNEGLPVVLGGDFNEQLDNDVLSALTDTPDLFAMTADDATTDAISYVGTSHRSLIDHIITSRDVVAGDISGDDAAIVRLDASVSDFSDTVSDHVPVVFRMVMRPDAIEIPGSNSAVTSIDIPDGSNKVEVSFS